VESTPRSLAGPIPPPLRPRPRHRCECRSGTR
jgi:hypothetical protein